MMKLSVIAYEKDNIVCYTNWKLGIAPTIAVPKARVSSNTMFVIEDNHEICASMTLDNHQDHAIKISIGNMKLLLIKSLSFTPMCSSKSVR